jgi:hypothetical protein
VRGHTEAEKHWLEAPRRYSGAHQVLVIWPQTLSKSAKPLSSPGRRLTETFLFLLKSSIQTMVQLEILADNKAPETQAVSVWPVIVFGLSTPSFYNDRSL